MRQNKLWLVAPALLAVTFLAPSCNNQPKDKVLNDYSWSEIKTISKQGKARENFKIGDTKDIKVNGTIHKVRIIGFNQDKDSKGKKIGITFEFENLLSDENGYSLATYWKNTNETKISNYDYMNSTIRAVLNGNNYVGSSRAGINWFQFFGTAEDTVDPEKGTTGKNLHFSETYKDKAVIDMLPVDLVNELAAPVKYVNVYSGDQDRFVETTVDDKLFLLSPREMGYIQPPQEISTTTYEFYEGHAKQTDEIRIKWQAKRNYGSREELLTSNELDGSAVGDKTSYAGYNSIQKSNYGSKYWLRSPNPNIYAGNNAWSVYETGRLNFADMIYVYNTAEAIAPAFCI